MIFFYDDYCNETVCIFPEVPRSEFKKIHRKSKELPFEFYFKMWRTEQDHKHYKIYVNAYWEDGRLYAYTKGNSYVRGVIDITNQIPKIREFLED